MLIKFINRGTGSAKAAQEYLIQDIDHRGEVRKSVKLLRGNPHQVTAVADSLDFKHRYRSAVIAWHKDDAPTDQQISDVLDDFERLAFAGLEPEQYCFYAVQHEEADGSKHVHIVTPRVELQSGRSMNIAPPGHQKTYDTLRDLHNYKNDWADPMSIDRRQTMSKTQAMIHSDFSSTKAKTIIHDDVIEAIDRGLISNREDMRDFLSQYGEITREGNDYISVKPDGFKKAIRMKGVIYERGFDIKKVSREVNIKKDSRAAAVDRGRGRDLIPFYERFKNTIARRSKYNQSRYFRAETRTSQAGEAATDLSKTDKTRFNQRARDYKKANEKIPLPIPSLSPLTLWSAARRERASGEVHRREDRGNGDNQRRDQVIGSHQRQPLRLPADPEGLGRWNRLERGVQGRDRRDRRRDFYKNSKGEVDDSFRGVVEGSDRAAARAEQYVTRSSRAREGGQIEVVYAAHYVTRFHINGRIGELLKKLDELSARVEQINSRAEQQIKQKQKQKKRPARAPQLRR
jgi:hypothetical protein